MITLISLNGCVPKLPVSAITASESPKAEKIAAIPAPEENRFVLETLASGIKEPMELTVTPENNVFWVERKGEVHFFEAAAKKSYKLKVPFKVFSGINDGLLGITIDPKYQENKFIYLYYSPRGEKPQQNVSRFTFDAGAQELVNEKILLSIPTQRETCCHSGGGLAFGPDGNLYIGVGDNSSPRTEPAYVPVDEQPGREAFDAQRTAGNTSDLRGKILRIRPEADGTYSIPAGNLFPKGTANTRPEIYAMGARNPIRLTVDAKTGYVYFGDVGPDATKADWYGPEAYDEFNVVKKPGNFGWPYFIGFNKAYPKYDFATKKAGATNDPKAPLNNSPNNTGLKTLPPIVAPMIWYSYEASPQFPVLGTGGRSAMAGPVYHYNPNNPNPDKFPEYYDNSLFIFDWMRDWIKAVKLDKEGNYKSMDHFMPGHKFFSPMDVEFGPDGTLYVLQYGKGWYSDNPDAKLMRISYVGGNRPPAVQVAASVKDGAVPLKVNFTSQGTRDLDGDALSYAWRFLNTGEVTSREPNPTFEFTNPGIYQTKLTVTDSQGNKTESEVEIIAGNTQPRITIELAGNNTFYWPTEKVKYQVKIMDAEDGFLPGGKIKPADVKVFLEYAAGGDNLSPMLTAQKKESAAEAEMLNHPGKVLIDQSDCRGCHAPEKESIGPSYQAIAQRYKNDATALDRLAAKIINGGGGVWKREFVMVGHPNLSTKAATEIVKYIYTLADEKTKPRQLTPGGILTLLPPAGAAPNGNFYLMASYADKGGPDVRKLETNAMQMLVPPVLQAEKYSGYKGQIRTIGDIEEGDKRYVNLLRSGRIFYQDIDLTNIGSITLQYSAKDISGTTLEIHSETEKGPLLGSVPVTATGKGIHWQSLKVPIKETKGKHTVVIIPKNQEPKVIEQKALTLISVDWVTFDLAKPKLVMPKPR